MSGSPFASIDRTFATERLTGWKPDKPQPIEEVLNEASRLIAQQEPKLRHFFLPLYRMRQIQIAAGEPKPTTSARDRRRYKRGRAMVLRMNPTMLDPFVARYVAEWTEPVP